MAVISPPPSIDIWMGTELPANIAARGVQQLQQRIEVARRGIQVIFIQTDTRWANFG